MLDFNTIRNEGNLLFESVRGSHLFGLNTETSDIDTFGIYCCSHSTLLGTRSDYEPTVLSEKNDDSWYELGKFIDELGCSNPNVLESIFTPKKWIRYFDPVLQPLWDIRDQLITKECFKTFAGYAKSQIQKAKGLKKAININPELVKRRKSPIEFCYVPMNDGDGDWTLEKWLRKNGLKQEHCGLVHLPNTLELYSLYYDFNADKDLSLENYCRLKYGTSDIEKYRSEWESGKKTKLIIYRGILDHDVERATSLRCSSITKEDAKRPLCSFQFNVPAYQEHCRDYKRYWDWVKNRNPERFELNKGHNYDGKNCCTCIRLMTMAKEMAQGKGMILDRTDIDREFLLSIKNHALTYDEIVKFMESIEADMEKAFSSSNLPERPDKELLNKIMIQIRKEHYGLC